MQSAPLKPEAPNPTPALLEPAAKTRQPEPEATPQPTAREETPAASSESFGPSAAVNDTAKILAGIKPSPNSPAFSFTTRPGWKNHAASMDGQWSKFESRLRAVRQWSAAELGQIDGRAPLFYPFSGPDFIYAFGFFPRASAYVLCGLEPVGDVPDLAKATPASLQGLTNSMRTLLGTGYFITKNMGVELRSNPLKGTLPILYVMLARADCTIDRVKLIPNGVEIVFTAPGGGERKLYYISGDASNGGLASNRSLLDLLGRVGARNSYVKAASYLLHYDSFSTVRNTMMNLGGAILQDDSGIPYRYFDAGKWQLNLFGAYTPPLSIFKGCYQGDLASAYKSNGRGKPLPFGAGYHWNPRDANLLLAVPK